MVFFLGYCSQEKVYSRCPEDEFKKNWKLKIFLSLWYLRLKFLAPRTEFRLEGEGGLSSFQCMRTVEPWGEVKNLVNLLHYMSFSVIESLSGSLFLSFGWKKRQELKNAFNRSKKTVWGEIFLNKTVTILYHFQI